jgi:hypothetical protein
MQGIDAPELHYKIYGRQIVKLQDRKANIEYYQPLSASAATVRGMPSCPSSLVASWPSLFSKDGKAQPKPPASYRQYLAQDSSLDEILLTKEFLEGGRRRPHSFLTYFKNDKLLLQPGELVLRDAPSYLFTEKGTANFQVVATRTGWDSARLGRPCGSRRVRNVA